MSEEYLIIHKSILPEVYSAVLKAKELVDDHNESVSEACKKMDISRSTFYKYKDNVFSPPKTYGKKAIVGLKTTDKKGVLSSVLSLIYNAGANVITINQDMPIKDSAYITIAIDIADMKGDLNELLTNLKAVEYVRNASLIAVE